MTLPNFGVHRHASFPSAHIIKERPYKCASNDGNSFILGPIPQGIIFSDSAERTLPKNMQRALERTVLELRSRLLSFFSILS